MEFRTERGEKRKMKRKWMRARTLGDGNCRNQLDIIGGKGERGREFTQKTA